MRHSFAWQFCAALFLSAGLSALGPGSARADDVTVFAAASLKTALDAIAGAFEADTGHVVTVSYAGTPVLARHIALGAPADIFISANPDWMDWAEARGSLVPQSRQDLLTNDLVLIAHGTDEAVDLKPSALVARLGDARIAMALVDAVPAGIYGKSALSYFGVWHMLETRIVQTDNVRAALALVALGEAKFGVVYKSDAIAEPRVSVIATFPPSSHPQITYPAALIEGRDTPAARAFFDYLRVPASRDMFERQGFAVVNGAS
ncbi:molybdate ABC transporter substrate-binding protein [Roseobacter sp. YSTF-M11]|uniref:Molybdate ABC transporter substrate-binding protein n=1 Tax=Roseobacter insulae TaxID=2859783 RepID=A0A9X1FYK7_9RHOB|nr:molybdate ABC transporter substrate-binding protein [Roseobacter insulae]MBW4710017.1 molybdate ABC transporter substrate-binding protein [Roseobacter insulae]